MGASCRCWHSCRTLRRSHGCSRTSGKCPRCERTALCVWWPTAHTQSPTVTYQGLCLAQGSVETAQVTFLNECQKLSAPCPQVPYGADAWPPGCIDFAFNLVRPCATPQGWPPLRATLYNTLLGRTLVFTTLTLAEDYRALVVQKLAGNCGDIVTLDGHKVRANGIVCGSAFAPAPLHIATYRFVQLPAAKVLL
jgi:hypothetical protein